MPDAEIHFLTRNSFSEIVTSNPYIDKVHVLAHSWELMIHELKEEGYDRIIDLHHNLRTLRVKKALRVPSSSFNKLNIQKWVFTNFKWNLMPRLHIVDRYMETIKEFGVTNDGKGLEYFISEKDIVGQNDIPVSHQAGYIAIAIGAAHYTKKLPVEKLKRLCNSLDHPVMLLGGEEDRVAGEEIASVDPVKVYNACGKFSLGESADLVRKSKLLISHDTGLMHIAAAFKTPVISVWGNTVPEFGMYPYYGDSQVRNSIFQVSDLRCRPCSKIGYNKCPRGHFKCMNKQDLDQLVKEVVLFLKN